MIKTKYYKVLNGTKAKDGGEFDYKDYLPKGKNKGKWLPKISNLRLCENGYHVTTDYNEWLNNGTVVYEVEGKGNKIFEENDDKICFETIRFVRKIETNKGKDNTGLCNSGDRNSGRWNSGDRNSGDMNSGYENSGRWNSGRWNSGDRNSGDWNSGDMNSGDMNSGRWNSGDRNSGEWNSGDMNSGKWNSGDRNSGYFNTNTPKIRIFNKLTNKKNIEFPSYFYFDLCEWIEVLDMTEDEKKEYWWYKTTQGYLRTMSYKEAWKQSFSNASKKEVEQTLKLPNFNYNIFEEITGITKQMIQKRLKE